MKKMAAAVHVHVSTVHRWTRPTGHKENLPIPFYVEIFFESLETKKKAAAFAKKLGKLP